MKDEISNEALVLAQDLGRELISEECTDGTLKDSRRSRSDRCAWVLAQAGEANVAIIDHL